MTRRRAWMAGLLLLLALALVPLRAQETPAPPPGGVTIHVVQRGETLYHIARFYGTTLDALAQLNGLSDPGSIQVGQRLLVPVTAVASVPVTHVIQPGETLRSIAALYNTTVEVLASINGIDNVDKIYVGQVLNITPPPVNAMPDAVVSIAPPAVTIYTIAPGDTLFRIATHFGISVNALAAANNISDPTTIFAGQQLVIPGFEPPQVALDLPVPVTGLDVLPQVLVEGQTARVRLTTAGGASMSAGFLNRPFNVVSEQGGTVHTLLLAVPLQTPTGVYPLQLTIVTGGGGPVVLNVNLQVLAGGYGTEEITLLADRNNLLDPAVEDTELTIIRQVMAGFTAERYFDGPMSLPAAAMITSAFGVTRSYNGGQSVRLHTGTDFAGAPGTPVLASASGRVVLADTLNVRGLATVIDHGWGVYTGYWHQAEQYVQLGDVVATGQVIGTIGATGRVTGAHLHWELWVNGTPVDPMQWVSTSFP